MTVLLMILLFLTAIFLIILVLIQRGKGGGLGGAFGGMGGQSPFGTKAGDLFTKITIGVAAFWIVLCLITVRSHRKAKRDTRIPRVIQSARFGPRLDRSNSPDRIGQGRSSRRPPHRPNNFWGAMPTLAVGVCGEA